MTNEPWRIDLHSWANQYASELASKAGILGVVIGGSLARGQEWHHSDLEIGILVEQKNEALPYFNVDAGRGVEIIQLARAQLQEQIKTLTAGDMTPVETWPIQLWKCRIVHDPSGILAQFKQDFDANLFTDNVIKKRIKNLSFGIKEKLAKASQRLAEHKPASALVDVRSAMNDLILAFHWAYKELPRSQSRTDSRLFKLCQKHSIMPLYELYQDVFSLANTSYVIETLWPSVKPRVLEITRLWGDSAREFFIHAVDSNFSWGEDAGILTVYRLYVPIIGGENQALQNHLDDQAWAKENTDLLAFLGLADTKSENVASFMRRIEAFVAQL